MVVNIRLCATEYVAHCSNGGATYNRLRIDA